MAFGVSLLWLTAYSGTLIRQIITLSSSEQEGAADLIILWLNIFLQDNASLAMSGVFWALIASIVLIPLVGYSFASIVPEGDLASVKVTDNHKITDSVFLQFVSSISFIQVITLTTLSSILTIGLDNPGFGIVVSWMIWALSVFASVLSAWFFEYLYRKFGMRAKIVSFGVIAAIVAGLLLFAFDELVSFFGLAEAYTLYIQSLSFENSAAFILGVIVFLGLSVILLYAISVVATMTLRVQERPRKRNKNPVILARFGLVDKNRINSLSQFFLYMIIRQSNIWKPLLLSVVFTTGMAVVFFAFYEILFTVSTLIPIMISLVWSVNFFGIIGSSTMWLVSLPGVRRKLLHSIGNVQYIIIIAITLLIAALLTLFYQPGISTILKFFLATVGTALVITQYSLSKAVNSPHRYRVHIRGESVLPPNKAFSYMLKLFALGFLVSGIIYGVGMLDYSSLGAWVPPYSGIIAQVITVGVIFILTRLKFMKLQADWLQDTEILQRIVKTVGTAN
jgi:hypothetical protein